MGPKLDGKVTKVYDKMRGTLGWGLPMRPDLRML